MAGYIALFCCIFTHLQLVKIYDHTLVLYPAILPFQPSNNISYICILHGSTYEELNSINNQVRVNED